MRKIPRISRACQQCGGDFLTTQYKIDIGRGKNCSKACQFAAQVRAIPLICETCDKAFQRKQSLVQDHAYCSTQCRPPVVRGTSPQRDKPRYHSNERTTDLYRKSFDERLWHRMDWEGPIPKHRPDLGPCWLWLGQLGHEYGKISPGGQSKGGKASLMVHKVVYEEVIGPVPDGLVLDHLCRVRHCCNPWHLEPVTQKINTLRGEGPSAINVTKTHCPAGHPYDADNTYMTPEGHRKCLECNRLRKSPYPTRQRAFGNKPRKMSPN